MVALLVYALLELLIRRAGFPLAGRAVVAQFAPLANVVLICTDGSRLRRLSGLAPPFRAILDALGWTSTDRYLTVHP
ncbi:MAG: hypothetical protein HYX51_00540 [Chloroflexi bacterium]|nr:hypothetical protein [Chloroflexota bacterium]